MPEQYDNVTIGHCQSRIVKHYGLWLVLQIFLDLVCRGNSHTARSGHGKPAADIPQAQTAFQRFAAQQAVKKTGVEAVSGAGGIDHLLYRQARRMESPLRPGRRRPPVRRI